MSSRDVGQGCLKMGVLADDLTGAGDVALAFEREGLKTEIALWPLPPRGPRGPVWILSTESRSLSSIAAQKRLRKALSLLKQWKAGFVFKKIDSTLRGPVKAEADAFIKGLDLPRGDVPVVPAFPAAGRTVREGCLYVDGKLLHRTAFGRDPRQPLRTSRVAALVGKGFWVPDVVDAAALRRVAREALSRKARAAIGSAGFAAALAKNFRIGARGVGRPAKTPAAVRTYDRGASKTGDPRSHRIFSGVGRAMVVGKGFLTPRPSSLAPILLVSGSAHPRSKRQLQALMNSENRGHKGLLAPRPSSLAPILVVAAPKKRGDPKTILYSIVRRAAGTARQGNIHRFAVTGGETAAALARELGVRRWRILGEADLGVPLAVSIGPGSRSWWVTKPGGFGQEDVWTKAISLLERCRSHPPRRRA